MPRISIVMPVYNASRFLRPALESILEQTFTDFELIAVDDASTDDSKAILNSFAQQDNRVVVVHQPHNQGVRAAISAGITHSGGEYIARMDADDISLPTRLAEQVKFLDQHPVIAVLGTWAQAINDQGEAGMDICPPTLPGVVGWNLLFASALIHPSVMMRRTALAAVGFYQQLTMYCEDYELWTCLNQRYPLANLPVIALQYRIAAGSATNARSRSDAILLVQRNMQTWANQSIALDIAEVLHDVSFSSAGPALTAPVIMQADAALGQLYQAYVRRKLLTKTETQLIRTDLARRRLRLAKRGLRQAPVRAILIALYACFSDPLLPLRVIKQ